MAWSVQTRMLAALQRMGSIAARDQGQGLIEYALIVSLIAIAAIVALQATGTSLHGILNKISGDV